MSQARNLFLLVVLAGISAPAHPPAQVIPPLLGEGDYVKQVFESHLGEAPKMAWIVPPNTVIAEQEHPAIYLYSSLPSVQRAELVGLIDKEELIELRLEYHVACAEVGLEEYWPHYEYELPTETVQRPERVFYTSQPLPAEIRVGFRRTSLPPERVDEILRPVEKEKPGALHKHFAVGSEASSRFYSFHGFYDPDTREMFLHALFLHGPDGQVLARTSKEVSGPLCDGCPIWTYEDSLEWDFTPLNLFVFEPFPFPVLMLDTSTVEGRAITFVTFTPSGGYEEYRLYEYVVNCF